MKNSEAETILTEWEQRTGKKIDRSNPASYEIILQIMVEMEKRRAVLQDGIRNDAAEYEVRKEQLDEALQIREDLQSGYVTNNQKGIAAYEEFMNYYDKGFGAAREVEAETTLQNDFFEMDALSEAPEELADESSFGFAPLTQPDAGDAELHGQTQAGKGKVEEPRRPQSPKGMKR